MRSYNLVKPIHTLPSSPAAGVPASSLSKTKPSKNSTTRHKKLAQSKSKTFSTKVWSAIREEAGKSSSSCVPCSCALEERRCGDRRGRTEREERERDDVKESRKEERRRRRVVGAGGRWLASATYLVTAKRPALLICGLWTERNNNPTWRVTIGTLDPGRPY
ncbi:unnamed protein product [Sphagnum troendelagicum]|uniref:Ribosomal protein S12 n=1 Tax=Sphagnum troendelagicum TaxID=128251 RepID=A0ABP0TZW2_9BRYO